MSLSALDIAKRARAAALHHLVVRPAARNEQPYGTHIPVLIATAKIRTIRSVLELGGGEFSTPLFLRRDAFPDLERLVVVESDPDWLPHIERHTTRDQRATVTFATDIASVVADLEIDRYDLILVDDSADVGDRSRTIKAVAGSRPTNAIVAVHDFEIIQYRVAARGFGRPVVVREFTPQTALFGATPRERAKFRNARRLFRHAIAPDEVENWIARLRDVH
jgi:CheY-like chemotaxis protein